MGNEYLEQLKDIEITCGYGWYGLILSAMEEISRYKYQGGKNDIKVIRAGEKVIVVNKEKPFLAYFKMGRIYTIENNKFLVFTG